jgi:hypothetical protein
MPHRLAPHRFTRHSRGGLTHLRRPGKTYKEKPIQRPKKLTAHEIQAKERIMETQTKNATIPEHAVDDVKDRLKYQSPFRPKATLLLDVLPAETVKTDKPGESSEELLQELLMNTEASAQRMQSAKSNWQLASLLLGMLLIATIAVIGWLYVETNATGTQRVSQRLENQSIKEQLKLAGAQITALKSDADALLNRNTELVSENAQLKSQSTAPIAAGLIASASMEQKPADRQVASNTVAAVASRQTIDTSRIEAIKKGTYPSGTSRAELIAALGEPDRVYKSRNYEQLVYFNRKPGRFWLIGDWMLQTTE